MSDQETVIVDEDEEWAPVAPKSKNGKNNKNGSARTRAHRASPTLVDRIRTHLDQGAKPRKAAPTDDAHVEANVGLLGLGGTGVRVTSEVFLADPEAPGLAKSFGFDLDSDENVPARSRHYQYDLIRQTGGLPAAGVFSFSELIADGILNADLADLDASAARFQATIERAVEASLYNVTMPVWSAGGGVGHGLFRAIHKAVPSGRSLTVPLAVMPGSRQPVPIRVSAAAAVGKFLAEPTLPLVLLADNDRLERNKAGIRRGGYRNRMIADGFRLTGAAVEHAFQHREADGNVDRALLNLARGEGPTTATFGIASAPCHGAGEASLLQAVDRAMRHTLAPMEEGNRRLMVFAVVPERVDAEDARATLEYSRFNDRAAGNELVGAFIGRTRSYTCDVVVWVTGRPRLPFLDRLVEDMPQYATEEEIEAKMNAARIKFDKAVRSERLKAIVGARDPSTYLDEAAQDMRHGIDVYRRRWRR